MKALALFSGGLDSLLAIKIIKDLGIEVVALHFNIGFGAKSDKSEILRQRLEQVGAELKIVVSCSYIIYYTKNFMICKKLCEN